ncbi:MAG: cadherin-like beta sandwich domain-containing protein [Nitrospira sp.]|nr:cadherin-like beta sandwich domain-containing protein [Nitrospira sp.]
MKHILTAVAQAHLATVLLAAIGFGTYGCADTASVNPVVELASLTITPGTLQPTFTSSTTQYSVDLTSDIASVTLSAQPATAGDSVTINGVTTTSRVIILGAAGSTTSVNIVVSESGSNSRTYTVLITRAGPNGNNSLQSLNVSPGTLTPPFDPNTLPYTVDVANNVGSVEVTPTLQDTNATMTVNGQNATSGAPVTVDLTPPGTRTTIEIIVTAQDGNQKPYLVTVSRGISSNANLQDLTITPGTLNPAFNAGTAGYSVNVASTVASVVVTPTLQDTAATMTVNGTPTTSGQARSITLLGPGLNTFINVRVTAENGSQNNYVVVVTRAALGDNNLSALTVKLNASSPNLISFSPNTTNYTVNVATTVDSLDVSATKAFPNAVMTGDVTAGAGNPTGNATIFLNGPGTSTDITISVTAPNGGTPKTYTVTVNRPLSGNNNLSALTVALSASDPNLINNFDPSTLSYTVDVASDIFSVTVIATLQDTNATMEVNGQGTSSGQAREITPLQPPGSPTAITIRVTPPNGIFKDYIVTVNRAPASPVP